jgi:hypothetical protein
MRLQTRLPGSFGFHTGPAGSSYLCKERTTPMIDTRYTSLTLLVKDRISLAGAWRALRLAQTSYPTLPGLACNTCQRAASFVCTCLQSIQRHLTPLASSSRSPCSTCVFKFPLSRLQTSGSRVNFLPLISRLHFNSCQAFTKLQASC